MKKKIIALCMVIISVLSLTSCGKSEDKEVTVGSKISGFVLQSKNHAQSLGADIYTFYHDYSGATLVYIENEDPEVAFNIFYHTPMVDETDSNHVFERAILSGSKKYPSSNLFFDMVNKSYNTYLNARSTNVMTQFSMASLSEEQLLKMTDVTLSCMVDPDIIHDKNIFKREAIRYQLYDEASDILMLGNIYAQDLGYETSVTWNHGNNILDTLYAGEYAANSIGRANLEYERLTYENVVATYERCYHFDNSLMILYGDLDYRNFLSFLNKEYLSKSKKTGTDLSMYTNIATKLGNKKAEYESPAYEGDTTDHSSIISYAIDLSDEDVDTIVKLGALCSIESSHESVFAKKLYEREIYNDFGMELSIYTAKPYLDFYIVDATSDDSDIFYEAVMDTLDELTLSGENPKLTQNLIDEINITNLLTRNSINVGTTASSNIAMWWILTGNTDYLECFENGIESFKDNQDSTVKSLSNSLKEAKSTALVTTVPTSGLAEKNDEARSQYLAAMKSAMTKDELLAFIKESKEFDEWNSKVTTNDDFMIEVSKLPEQEIPEIYEEVKENGLRILTAPVDVEGVGEYSLYLDTSAIDNEDLLYLRLFEELFGEFDTDKYTYSDIGLMYNRYLYDFDGTYEYICDANGEKKPAYCITWKCKTEDFKASLDVIMNIFTHSDFNNPDKLQYIISSQKEYYNPTKLDASDVAIANAAAGSKSRGKTAIYEKTTKEEFYGLLCEIEKQLSINPDYSEEVDKKLHQIAGKILVKGNTAFTCVAAKDEMDEIINCISKEVDSFKEQTVNESMFILPETKKTTAVILDSNISVAYMFSGENEDFRGRYAAFVQLISDRYITQKVRMENGAYNATAIPIYTYLPAVVMFSYSDPKVSDTVDIFREAADYLETANITQDELNGYILSAYSELTSPLGILYERTLWMKRVLGGLDSQKRVAFYNDVKNATVDDKDNAVKALQMMLDDGTICVAGNEKIINACAEKFDEITSFR